MDSANNNHGYLDCFVLVNEPFTPNGALQPDQLAAAARRVAQANKGWFAFDPRPDPFSASSGIDLRSLNEKTAGDGGFIGVKGSQFVHSKTGEPVRFWAVNGPSSKDSRRLAQRGADAGQARREPRPHPPRLLRHKGDVDMAAVRHAFDVVEAMKAEGIYSHFSIYFPLWLKPKPDTPWLKGYDGNKTPFAALFFNKDFQKQYQTWWKALLLTPNPSTGTRLIDDPAVAGLEIINEDSYFFWTFNPDAIPDPEMRIVETQFGDWLKRKYGSIDGAFRTWGGPTINRDRPAEGRIGFRPLWNMFNERTARDKDAARFLVESQRGFYREMQRFLRGLGFKGVITASNWITASPEVLGPLEKYTYTAGDFIDRHGYFGCRNKGEAAEWSIRDGHTYVDRSALSLRRRRARQAQGLCPPGDGPQLRRQAVDDLGDDLEPAQPLSLGGPALLRRLRRAAGQRRDRPLRARYGAVVGQAGLLHAALDADVPRDDGPVPGRRPDLPQGAGRHRRLAGRPEPEGQRPPRPEGDAAAPGRVARRAPAEGRAPAGQPSGPAT